MSTSDKRYRPMTGLLCALILTFLPNLSEGAPSVEERYQNARTDYYSLFSSPHKMADRKSWDRVITQFQKIAESYPKTGRGRDASYTVGLLYKRLFEKGRSTADRDATLHWFNRVINRYPDSTLVDDAQRHIGDVRFRSKETAAATRAYRKAVTGKRRVSSLKKKESHILPTAGKIKPKKKMAASTPPPKKQSIRRPKTVKKVVHSRVPVMNSSLATLTEVKAYAKSDYTRIILYLSGKTAYRYERIKKPDRLFIDLLDTRVAKSLPAVIRFRKGTATSLRTAQNRSKVARVAIDLDSSRTSHSVIALSNPFRIVIDVGRTKRKRVATKKNRSPSLPITLNKQPPPVPRSRASTHRITIVIDAGHGGKDPGAIGPTGLKEKTVTLALARQLRKELQKRATVRIIMTRTTDRFLELDERTVIANNAGADLFISIHTNASRNRRASGIETYFLSPARSKDELETAARENMLALGSRNPVENDLAYIMSDLTNTQKVNDSGRLAATLQRSVVRGMQRSYRGTKDKGVKKAMFYVLWRATMPSALVETGFISHRRTEKRFRDRRYIAKVARGMADGVISFTRKQRLALAR